MLNGLILITPFLKEWAVPWSPNTLGGWIQHVRFERLFAFDFGDVNKASVCETRAYGPGVCISLLWLFSLPMINRTYA